MSPLRGCGRARRRFGAPAQARGPTLQRPTGARALGLATVLGISLLVAAGFPAAGAREGTWARVRPDAAQALHLNYASEPLSDILEQLGREGGLRLEAERGLGERSIHAVANGLTPAQARTALAHVVDGSWADRDAGKRLRLEPSPAARREQERILRDRQQRLVADLRQLASYLALDKASGERLATSDPVAWSRLSRPESRGAIRLASLLRQPQWDRLFATGQLRVSARELGPSGPAALRDFGSALQAAHLEIDRTLPEGVPRPAFVDPKEAAENPLDFRVAAGPSGQPWGAIAVNLAAKSGDHTAAGALVSGSRAESPPGTRWIDRAGSPGDLVPPGQQVTVRFQRAPSSWAEALRAVAEQASCPVVSEDCTRRMPPPVILLQDGLTGPLPEVLDGVCRVFGYQWRFKSPVFEFRSATWYVDRDREPPASLLKALSRAREEKRNLGLGWLADASALTPERLGTLAQHASQGVHVVSRSRAILQLYATLSPAQRESLTKGDSLAAASLSPAQRAAFVAALTPLAPGWPAVVVGRASVRLTQDARRATFVFASGEASVECPVMLPPPAAGPGGLGGPGPSLPPPPGLRPPDR